MNKKHIAQNAIFNSEIKRISTVSITALCCLSLSASLQAAPQGGQVSAGSGSIQSSSHVTQITQNSQQLVIDWDSFNVGVNETVNFLQPNSSSSVLNQIFDQSPSQILGNINANGRVFLSNPNGLVFGVNSQVNVGSLFATTLSIGTNDFMESRYNFSAITEGGTIINHGLLNAATGGSISLVADAVDNQGEIVAHYGHINLASGRTATVDFDGDGLMLFEIDGTVLNNATGKTTAVNNSGNIRAEGGEVILTAQHAENVFVRAVNNDGLIEAGRMLNEGGVIRLVGIGGDTVHSGVIDVSGQDAVSTGGEVHILGERVGLFDAAIINASGSTGGGTVLVGGDFQGANSDIQNANQTLVSRNSQIMADAQQSGDGGRVIIWADGYTQYLGSISATGGTLTGNGGFVEVSGKQQLGFDGWVDTSAVNGEVGQLLLDPDNIIVNSSGSNTTDIDDVKVFGNVNCTDCTIAANTLVLANADITLQATNDITFSETLTLTGSNSLTAQANNDISLDSGVTVQTQGSGTITLTANDDSSGGGSFTMGSTSNLQTAGGDITISAAGDIALAGINAGTGTASITTSTSGAITSASTLVAGTLILNSASGDIGTSGTKISTTTDSLTATTTGAGTIYVTNSTAVTLTDVSTGSGTIDIDNTIGDITVTSVSTSGEVSLTSDAGDIVTSTPSSGSLIVAGLLNLSAVNGKIGTSAMRINTTVTSLNADTSTNNGDIFITETNAIVLATIDAGSGDIDIRATDINATGSTNLTADKLSLDATSGGIGASGNAVNTTTTGTMTLSTGGSGSTGDIYIVESNALTTNNIDLTTASGGTQTIDISADSFDLDKNIGDASDNLSLTATVGGISGSRTLTALTLSLTANGGSLGASGSEVNTAATTLIADTSATDGDIYISESNAVILATINAGAGDITISATDINDAGSSSLTATTLSLTASAGGIGASGNEIDTTTTGQLSLTSGGDNANGDIYIVESNALSISQIIILATSGSGTQTVGLTAAGITIDGSIGNTADHLILNSTVGITGSSGMLSANMLSLTAATGSLGTLGARINTTVTTLNADTSASGGDIFISETNAINLATINAGSGDINIIATDINDAGSSSLTAAGLTLTASTGGIGASGNQIDTNVTTLNANTSASDGDIFINETNAITLEIVNAGAGNITISATDINDAGSSSLTATNLSLSASGGSIGASGNEINTNVTTLNANTSISGGDIFITETDDVTLVTINAGSGDITINATDINDAGSSSLTAADLTLTASAGGIGAFGNEINTNVTTLNADTSASGDAIFISDSNAVNLGLINAGAGNINITAADINDAGSSNLTATNLTLTASAGGIGASGNDINTSVAILTATASAGDIYLSNTGAVIVDLLTASADIGLSATGAITDNETDNTGIDLNAGGLITLQSGGGIGESASDSLNISATTLAITGAGGDVFITQDNSLSLAEISAVGNAVTIEITGGGITDNSSLITADTLSLTVNFGSSVGASSAYINTDLSGALAITAKGAGDVYINEVDTTTNDGLSQVTIFAETGDVGLVSAGDISGAGSLITGSLLTIASTNGSIGSVADTFNTQISTLDVSANTDVYLTDTGTLLLSGFSGGSGSNNITAGSTLNVNTTGGSSTVSTISSGGSQNYTASFINVYDNLSTSNRSISLNANDVSFNNAITLDTNTAGGDIVITGIGNSSDSLTVLAGSGDIQFIGSLLYTNGALTATTSGELFLNGGIGSSSDNIALSASQITLQSSIQISTGNGGGDLTINGSIDSSVAGVSFLSLDSSDGAIDLSNAVIGSTSPLQALEVKGNGIALGNAITNGDQRYDIFGSTGLITLSGSVSLTSNTGSINLLADVSGSGSSTLSLSANSGEVIISGYVASLSNLNLSADSFDLSSAGSIEATNSINFTKSGTSTFNLSSLNLSSLTLTTSLLSLSSAGSINIDVDTTGTAIDSALNLNATGGSGSNVIFSQDTSVSGALTVLANDGIQVNALIQTLTTGADINLHSDANNTAETNDNILFSAANIVSAGSLIMSATNGGIELQGGTDATTGTTTLSLPNGGLDIQGISVDGQSDATKIYILAIDTVGEVNLGNIGQTNLIDSLSVSTSGNVVNLYGDISTRRSAGVNLGNDISSVILGSNVTIDTTNGNGSVSLAAVEGAYSLDINSGNGSVSLADIGQSTALTTLSVVNLGTTAITGNITTSAAGGIDFSGASDIDITGDISLTAGNGGTISLTGGTVDGDAGLVLTSTGITRIGGALTLAGTIDFNNASNVVVDNDLTLTSSSAILGGSITTAAGVSSVDLSGAGTIVLDSDLSLDTSNSDAAINLAGVDISGSNSLSLVSGAGDITLNTVTDITSLSVSGSGVTTLNGNLSTIGVAGINLSAATNILLGTNVTIDTSTNSGTIDITGGSVEGPNALTLTTNEGIIQLGDMGQGVALSSLTINSTGMTVFNDSTITTQGSGINLSAATDVDITGDVIFNSSSGSGTISLNGGAIDGPGGLTVNVNRGDLFLGAVGQDIPLAYLIVNGEGANEIAGNIATLGNVDFSNLNIDSIDPAIDLLINAGSGDVSLAAVGENTTFLYIVAGHFHRTNYLYPLLVHF